MGVSPCAKLADRAAGWHEEEWRGPETELVTVSDPHLAAQAFKTSPMEIASGPTEKPRPALGMGVSVLPTLLCSRQKQLDSARAWSARLTP